MRINASTLATLLESDLLSNGWIGSKDSDLDQTPRQFAMTSISKSLTKKFLSGTQGTTPETDAKALDLFLKVNENCREFQYRTSELPDHVKVALGEAKSFLYNFFYLSDRNHTGKWGDHEKELLNLGDIAQGFGVGPGSSIGSPSTDWYSKFALSDLCSSNSLLPILYRQAICGNKSWASLEALRLANFGSRIDPSSRLSFVPKTSEISRTICTEPVLNMIFQKGIASLLEGRLQQVVGIDLRIQPDKNRRLARVGSITGEFGTIDLSSASDSMSLQIVEEFFPPPVVRWLKRTSCRSTVLPDGRTVELHMISSMGNAFTFPLQTIFFTSLVYGAYRALEINLECPRRWRDGNFAVFGDDIIVKKEAYDLLINLLTFSGFAVNVDKSFNSGLFRESCGHDYYSGHNVRGVYIRNLNDMCDFYSAINRLNRWSAAHGVVLNSLVTFLTSRCRFNPVPYDEDDIAGIKIPRELLKERVRSDRNTGGLRYRAMTVRNRSFSVDPLKVDRGRPRGFMLNPDGLLLALLVGSIRNGRIGVRVPSRKVVVKQRFSSRWDYIPADQIVRSDFSERWKSFVSYNLMKI
jgi:hypothetical protein